MSFARLTSAALWIAAAMLWPGAGRPAAGQESSRGLKTPKLTQAALAGWFRGSIVEGRIVVDGRRFGSAIANPPGVGAGADEQLTIRAVGRNLSISYQRSGPEGEFSVEVSDGARVHMLQEPKPDSPWVRLEFEQDGEKPIRLTVGPKPDATVYEASDLWHLALAEPEVWRKHLAPLVAVLVRAQDLVSLAGQVETALVKTGAAGTGPDRDRWLKLVEQLGDDQFSRREAADRQLRQVGPPVVTFLARLDRTRLDAEQQYRVRRIIRALSDREGEDTPGLVASWLAGDPAAWLALLGRDEESTRRLAARQLAALLGKPIAFDPAADAEVRRGQIERLRAMILEE